MRKITPEQWDSLTARSGRQVVRCYANVLKNGAATGRVPCGGTVALDTFEEIERTASLSIPQELDWLAVELQPVMEIDGEEYPLGVFLPSSPEKVVDETGNTVWEVECYDRTLILSEDRLTKDTTFYAGTEYLALITGLFYTAGIDTVAVLDPSDAALPTDRTFEQGTSRLQVINTLLDEINYNKVRCDADGNFFISAYKEPVLGASDIAYQAGDGAVLLREAEVLTDYFNRPNVFSVLVDNPELEETYYSEYINDDPGDPLSTTSRGRYITADEEQVGSPDVTGSQEDLDLWLKRRVFELSRSSETVKFYTLPIPVHEALDSITLHLDDDINGIYQETGWEIKLEAGQPMSHTVRRFYYAGG